MCGLVGLAGNLTYKDKELFKNLMVVSSLRGEDSAGVAYIPLAKPKEAEVVKSVGSPYDLFAVKKFDTGFHDKQAAIGHTRKATVGGVHRHTAHPFESGNIVGVHNGTLRNWRTAYDRLEKDFSKYFNTDSETLINAISEFGVKDAIEHTDGAYALVWFDKEEETLNFLRNNERTLWYAYSEAQDVLYWASEYRMLELCLMRNEIKLHVDDKGHRFFAVPANLWVKMKVDNTGNKKVELLSTEKLEGNVKKQSNVYHPTHQAGPYSWRSAWNREEFWEGMDEPLPETLVVPKKEEKALQGIPPAITKRAVAPTNTNLNSKQGGNILLPPFTPSKASVSSQPDNKNENSGVSDNFVLGHRGQVLEETTYDNMTKHGCAWCQGDVTFEDAKEGGIGKWLTHDSFLCKICYPPERVGVGAEVRSILTARKRSVNGVTCN